MLVSEQTRRSLLGLVTIYNMLPQDTVDIRSVADFQGKLQGMILTAAERGLDDWEQLLSPRPLLYRHPLLRW